MFEWTFDMPISFIGPYVSSEISKEVDFRHEAENSERTRDLIAAEPSLAGHVVTPCVVVPLRRGARCVRGPGS